ncbi:MAG: hypothetical protein U0841_28120 [Chloroflexia bacterium]
MSGWFRTRLPVRRAPEAAPTCTNPPLTFRSVERTLALFVAGLTDGAGAEPKPGSGGAP